MTSPTFQRCLVVAIQMGCWVVQLGLLSKRAPLPWSCLSARVIKHWKPIWAKWSNCIFTLLQLEQPQQQNATSAAWAIYTSYKMLCPVQPALWSYNNDRVQGHYCCFSSVLCINVPTSAKYYCHQWRLHYHNIFLAKCLLFYISLFTGLLNVLLRLLL